MDLTHIDPNSVVSGLIVALGAMATQILLVVLANRRKDKVVEAAFKASQDAREAALVNAFALKKVEEVTEATHKLVNSSATRAAGTEAWLRRRYAEDHPNDKAADVEAARAEEVYLKMEQEQEDAAKLAALESEIR